ncbi:MAG: ferredoxin [Candidatus Marinimicrobia bacterium]|nr:ferredoxin [Candidatus Neomarinimicrobiota bacterium]MCF7829750.1 ferredoxin [Candidatus Neomarinimicrobiota bacterium]MCF7881700.1 ferredoxin [Candidatus Neomarinimicrobiota bacterium]
MSKSKKKQGAQDKPFRIIFEGKKCIGTGKCAEVSENWSMDLTTGLAKPGKYYIDEDELESNMEAARQCPAKKGLGVIHIIDGETGQEIYPDPDGTGEISLDN